MPIRYNNMMKMHKQWLTAVLFAWVGTQLFAAEVPFDGLNLDLGNLARISSAQSRSISPENFTGEKGAGGMSTNGPAAHGAARELGQGWKVSPFVRVKAHATFTLADIDGPGSIQQIWMTPSPLDKTRDFILRIYWDGDPNPSVECPVGDFFACGMGRYCQISSLPVCVNPGSAFNSYWQMPFRKHCRITLENLDDSGMSIYYQINYTLTTVPDDAAYFHAHFRRENPLKTKGIYTILDDVEGQGQYVGTYLAWGVHSSGWWGEGEIKFYLDGDTDFPTICGTGTEDYFCGSYDFDTKGADGQSHYTEFSTPYSGLAQVIRPDGHYDSQTRFGLYRWHIRDPIRFQKNLKVTIQALGWQSGGRYLQLQDDIASVAFWYQTLPQKKYPPLPSRDDLEAR
jgi:hypothetical protein